MKTVSGEVVSTKPISLSKAANILSKFASSDNGATPAFAAYLRRASASFDELAQLHKKHKTPGGEDKVKKKRHSESIVSEGTVHSDIGIERKERHRANKDKAGRIDIGLNVDVETRQKSEDEGRLNAVGSAVQTEGRIGEEIVDGNLADVDIGKKSKKKGRKNEAAAATEEQHLGDHDAINANELKNMESFDGSKEKKKKKREKRERENNGEIESLDVSREMRTKKKNDKHGKVVSADANGVKNEIESLDVSREMRTKNKNDKHGKDKNVNAVDVKNEIESSDVTKERRSKNKNDKLEKGSNDDLVDIKKEMQSREDGDREAIQVVENDGDVQKKRKKHKKKYEIKEERVDDHRDEIEESHGGETDHADKGRKKKHKIRSHDEERENEVKVDPEGANIKESRKRKPESVGDGEFDGSQERHKSKKKKR